MLWEIIATGFYIGRVKFAPGTLGTLLAIPLIYIFAFKWWSVLTVSLILFLIGVFASNYVIIFRLIDILKPFPVNLFEKLPRGWGVMADDITSFVIITS